MSRRKIILDVDTGHDDAIAIMMAAASPDIELVALTVTAGNQTLPKTLRNTLNLCSALGIRTPVYPGMTRPILCDLEPAPLIHGESGFDGPVFESCDRTPESVHASSLIVSTVMASPPDEITVVAVGPLSNIAMAIRLEPAIAPRLREIVLMGGSAGAGNVTPSAEFNIHADPEAASIVFGSGARITMIGLDVTTRVQLDVSRLAQLGSLPGRAAPIFVASMRQYTAACMKYAGECPAMHDPCCIAYLLDPGMFGFRRCAVEIELAGTCTRGRTVVDLSGITGKAANTSVALSVCADRFWPLLENALLHYH